MKHPPLRKRIAKHPLTHLVLCRVASLYIRFIYLSSRVEKHIHPESQALFDAGTPALLSFWHGRMLLMFGVMPKTKPTYMLISHHNDGRLIARITRQLGAHIIHGSTSKGGVMALRSIITELRKGHYVSITPDGPRGPFQRASHGIAHISQHTHTPVIPISYSTKHHKQLKSWDKFILPRPFTHLVYVVGKPILPSVNGTHMALEEYRITIEQALNDVTQASDQRTHTESLPC